jgi:polyhydroxyalkanoate synthesis regulator phasin
MDRVTAPRNQPQPATIIERDHFLQSLLDRIDALEEKVRKLEEKASS